MTTEKQQAWRKYKVTMALITFILVVCGFSLGFIQYNYEIDKCEKMNSHVSNYDFDYKVELDADFSKDCFYYMNHPLALFWLLFGNVMCALVFSLLGWAFWAMYLDNRY